MPESVKVVGSDRGCGFDLYSNDLALPVFQDTVYLDLVVIAIVI
jgi:hypothetical protein